MNSNILFVNGISVCIASESECHAAALNLINSMPFRLRHGGFITVRIVRNDDRQTLVSTYDVLVLSPFASVASFDMLPMVSAILTNSVKKVGE